MWKNKEKGFHTVFEMVCGAVNILSWATPGGSHLYSVRFRAQNESIELMHVGWLVGLSVLKWMHFHRPVSCIGCRCHRFTLMPPGVGHRNQSSSCWLVCVGVQVYTDETTATFLFNEGHIIMYQLHSTVTLEYIWFFLASYTQTWDSHFPSSFVFLCFFRGCFCVSALHRQTGRMRKDGCIGVQRGKIMNEVDRGWQRPSQKHNGSQQRDWDFDPPVTPPLCSLPVLQTQTLTSLCTYIGRHIL